MSKKERKLVVINQAVNYLTIGLCNAFAEKFDRVALITGSIHVQGEELRPQVKVKMINKWVDKPAWKKFISYIIATFRIYFLLITRYRKYEVFFISLPPMGYLLNLFTWHKFSMLVWDVYPDVFKITGMSERHLMYRIWSYLNKKSFKKAYKVFTIGNRMGDLLEKYVSRDKLIIQPIWSIFQKNEKVEKADNPFISQHQLNGQFIVQYSGNIGLTHKVEVVVALAEILKEEKGILFQIIGRGPREPYLKELVEKKRLPNCMFLPFQSDDMFPYSLSAADLGIVILDSLTSKGSVPSKSYNLMSFGIPSIYISAPDSELNDYAHRFGHAKCFSEDDLQKASEFIVSLSKDKALQESMSQNALKAAGSFKRENADKIVERYFMNN